MTDKLSELVDKMVQVGQELQVENPSENVSLLYDFKREVTTLSYGTKDKNLLFFSYFFNSFLEDIFCNIAVDSSYREEISDDDKDDLLKKLGKGLEELAKQYKKKDFAKCHETYASLVEDYLKIMRKFEERIESHLNASVKKPRGVQYD